MNPPTHQSARLIVTGCGLVTPLGYSPWQTFRALLDGKTIADKAANLPTDISPIQLVRAVGCVHAAAYNTHDPAIELAERAARSALEEAALLPADVLPFLGVSKGAMHALHSAPGNFPKGALVLPPAPDAPLAVALGPIAYLAYHLQRRLGIARPTSVVAACASGLTALHLAGQHLRQLAALGQYRSALVVSAEASLLPMFIHSYKRLGVLAPLKPDQYRALPLDQQRQGFLLSEQSAALVIQAVPQVQPGQIELQDIAVASESFHLIQPDPNMTSLRILAGKMLASAPPDLLHPHATGTVEQDQAELNAYAPFLSQNSDVYACKGAIGHGLGVAGLASLIIACLCAKTRRRPPMPWLTDPVSCHPPLSASSRPLPAQSRHAVFAAGFGGHLAAAILQQH
ncbi:MAG: hypothetical protein IT443_05925 [Phycisphaeraceae bacterium]|nr:hypothetical protein [Phycisphaeraceae bacterium]